MYKTKVTDLTKKVEIRRSCVTTKYRVASWSLQLKIEKKARKRKAATTEDYMAMRKLQQIIWLLPEEQRVLKK